MVRRASESFRDALRGSLSRSVGCGLLAGGGVARGSWLSPAAAGRDPSAAMRVLWRWWAGRAGGCCAGRPAGG